MEKQKLKVITDDELKILKKKNRCCILINDFIYDVTEFQEHPGGFSVLQELEGTDATKAFNDIGHSNTAKKLMKKYLIGVKKDTKKYKDNISTKTEENKEEFIWVEEEEIEEESLEEEEEEEELEPISQAEKGSQNYYLVAAVIFVFSIAYYFMFLN